MKTIFLKDNRLREILVARNEKITEMLSKGKLKGSLDIKLSTDGENYGWQITDFEDGQTIKELLGEQKEKIEPTGTITPQKDIFKFKSKNLGLFKKGD